MHTHAPSLHLDKVVKWAGSVFRNRYTLLGGQGYFEGTQEDSLVLSAIIDGELELEREVLQLKKELGQKPILVSRQQIETVLVSTVSAAH